MSRGWIIGIICLAISSTSVPFANAQDGRSESSSGVLSLSERLASLRDKFTRNESEPAVQSKPSKRATRPTYGSHYRRKPSASSPARSSKPKSLLPSINPSSLLPDGFFGRKDSAPPRSPRKLQKLEAAAPIRVATAPRVGSASGRVSTKQKSARRSPATTRANELEAALADLIPNEDAQATDQSLAEASDDFELPAPITVTPTPRQSDGFDLHEALVDDVPSEAVAEDPQRAANRSPTTLADAEATVSDEETLAASQPVFVTPTPLDDEPVVHQDTPKPFEAAAVEDFSSSFSRNQSSQQSPLAVGDREAAEGQASGDVLSLSYQQPAIVSHVEGPRRIMVGREATYRITLENTSNTAAKSLAAAIRVPKWAEVVDATSTSGVVERASQEAEAGRLEWKLSELSAQSSETIRIRLIPRSGQPLQIGIEWSQAPMASETMVEVQEPKLHIKVSGPKEVLFGKPQRYRLTLSNPGTGPTEQVVIQLIPPGGDASSATTQKIGTLKPSEVRNLDLELTAREAGELTIQASATAEGGLTAKSVSKVLCQKPELQIDWRGPESKYAGTLAAYYFRVRNPGTASTGPVTVHVKLPEGAKFSAASDGHRHDLKTNVISWQLPEIAAGQEKFMQVRCKVEQPGNNTFDVTAQTESGDLSDSKAFNTDVVALADLKLDVSDPQGPIPLDETVLYEIRIRNRGTTAAEGINVVGLFSAGIDPTSVEGAQYAIRDGRVTFHPIKSLPAGGELVLRIRATAKQAGTHTFRAEVACQDLEIKLAAEETTRFFEDEFRWEDGKTPYSAERSESIAR
ncbi:MAG: hypothetical protein GXP26_05410 [Planctomycetes bacterium]|nr:hypothetical protein [Planctomycetota bacterium]